MVTPLEKIYASTLKFLVPLSVKQTYRVIAKEAINLVNGSDASIFLYQDGKLKKVYTTNKELKEIKPRKYGATYGVFHSGIAQLRHKDELLSANKKFNDLPIASNITLPLVYGHIRLGVLSVLSKKTIKFTSDDLELLNLFAPLATMAIRKTQYLKEAEQAIKARDLFISLAEHEIKNPLTVMYLNLEILKANEKIKRSKSNKYIKILDRTTQRLVHLVDELLQSNQVKTGKLKYQFSKQNLLQICEQVLEEYRLQYPFRKFRLINESEKDIIPIWADEIKIKQVITNIINNSLKFSPAKSPIDLEINTERGFVIVKITDQGIGIPKKALGKVFKKFYQGNSMEKGIGVGLYLVKKVITKHNGKIKIESELKKGTTLSFTLPVYYPNNDRKIMETSRI